ncbi:hypothetical protein [Streptomyces sp. NPDC101150]|uniref:hypothetical protein n=1 Tax=Streptomyces sp. NPDC101150 TaxID=3366114 RepID=UPI00380C9151
MASKETKYTPTPCHVPKTSVTPPKGSGEEQEMGPAILQSRPQFTEKELGDVKEMVAGSNPGEVGNVAEGWKQVRIKLVGGGSDWTSTDWDGGIKKHFDDAVTKVLQTWHGPSADQFAKTAQDIGKDFANLAAYPHLAGYILHQVSENLSTAKEAVAGIEEPSWWDDLKDKVGDSLKTTAKGAAVGTVAGGGPAGTMIGGAVGFFTGGRDDSGLKADLKNPNITIGEAAQRNAGNIDPEKQASLLAGHYVEQLATTYRAGSKALAGVKPRVDDGGRIQRPDNTDGGGNIGGITPFIPPGSGPKGGATVPKIPGMKGGGYTTPQPMEPPRPGGIDGGIGSIPKSPAPQVGTGLDGFSGGLGTGGGAGAGGGIGGGIGGGGGVGAGGLSGSGIGGGSTSGMSGGGMPGVPGMVGGAAGRGGGAAGAGARGMGRAGMPGMAGGAGAGKGAGAGAGGKGGALARQKGGVVGGKGGKSGVGGQGGSGLHRSRGGTQQGAKGGRRPAGMAGAPGAHGGKGKGKGENGQRPDYLVEDEETWTKERNVAPKVIE